MIQRWIRLGRYERLFSLDPPYTLSTDLLSQLDHFRATKLQRRLQHQRRLQQQRRLQPQCQLHPQRQVA